MPLDEIRLLSDLDETTPDGAVVDASEIDDYLKQVKGFIKNFLSVAHNDDGSLKDDSANLTFDDIGGQVKPEQIEVRSIGPEHLDNKNEGAAAVLRASIADDAVGEDELADASVTAAKLAANAVTTDKILDAAVTADKLAGNIPASKISGLDGANVSAGSITADKLAVNASLSTSVPGLAVITNSTSSHRFAKIAGALSATLVDGSPPELRFSFANSLGTDSGMLAVLREMPQLGKNAITPTVYKNRNMWVRESGESVCAAATVTDFGDAVEISNTGIYLLFFYIPVWGAPLSGTAYVETQVTDEDASLNLGKTSQLVITDTVARQHYMFGLTSITITTAPSKIMLRTLVTDTSGGTWTLGDLNTSGAFLAILGIGEIEGG